MVPESRGHTESAGSAEGMTRIQACWQCRGREASAGSGWGSSPPLRLARAAPPASASRVPGREAGTLRPAGRHPVGQGGLCASVRGPPSLPSVSESLCGLSHCPPMGPGSPALPPPLPLSLSLCFVNQGPTFLSWRATWSSQASWRWGAVGSLQERESETCQLWPMRGGKAISGKVAFGACSARPEGLVASCAHKSRLSYPALLVPALHTIALWNGARASALGRGETVASRDLCSHLSSPGRI